ncbi:MAG: GNAT family N-acetyltransferase [Anaerolineae bacterium]|nr:GNAT family N-acetyltransferase [Anaerolineae bacterium]
MNLEIHQQPAVFEALQPNWNALLAHSDQNLIFLTHEWQQAWWEAYHPGQLFVITGRDDSGALVGIAPWFIETRDDHNIIRTIGCVDVTDYLDIIVDKEHITPFLEALASTLADHSMDFGLLNLCNIPDGSPLLTQWPEMLQAQGFSVTIEQQEVCPVIPLPESWDEYLSQLNKKQRHELRRKIRRAGQQVDWYIVGPEHDLNEELEAFMQLMAASNPEKAEFLQDEQHVAFFRNIVPRLQAAGWLQLCFLTVGEERAAAYLNLDWDNRIMVYNSGQDIEQYGSLSAGIVLLAYTIRHAIENGRTEFDMLRGNEGYKYQMGGQDTPVFSLMAAQA